MTPSLWIHWVTRSSQWSSMMGLLPTLRVANWVKPPTRLARPTLQSPCQTPGHLWKKKKKDCYSVAQWCWKLRMIFIFWGKPKPNLDLLSLLPLCSWNVSIPVQSPRRFWQHWKVKEIWKHMNHWAISQLRATNTPCFTIALFKGQLSNCVLVTMNITMGNTVFLVVRGIREFKGRWPY